MGNIRNPTRGQVLADTERLRRVASRGKPVSPFRCSGKNVYDQEAEGPKTNLPKLPHIAKREGCGGKCGITRKWQCAFLLLEEGALHAPRAIFQPGESTFIGRQIAPRNDPGKQTSQKTNSETRRLDKQSGTASFCVSPQ